MFWFCDWTSFLICEKTFSISKCEVQKIEHPTEVVSTKFERNKILAYFSNKQARVRSLIKTGKGEAQAAHLENSGFLFAHRF